MNYLGDFAVSSTVRGMWNSNAVAGESITRSTNGSLRIYKNNSTTERSSAAGITDTEDFDSLTGVHHYNIDLSDDTDAGFYAAGNDYFVVLSAATIDGKSINAVIGCFSIENRNIKANVTQFGGSNITSAAGIPEVKVASIANDAITAASIAADALGSSELAATAATEIATAVGSSLGISAHEGTAQAGGASSVTLASGASAVDDIYNYQRVDITSGTGAGQSAIITDYVGSTKVATVDHAWQTAPDNTSVYRVAYSRVPRDVSTVTGDVQGKILGTTSGGGTISGAGVWAYDNVGAALSTAAKLLKYFQLAFRKDAAIATDNATEVTAINADGGSGAGAFANTTDSLEALRDRGDASWLTGIGYEVFAAVNTDDAGDVLITAFLTLNGVKVALASGSCQVICREATAGADAWTASSSTVVDGFYFNVSHALATPANGENYLFKVTITDALAVARETVVPLPAQ